MSTGPADRIGAKLDADLKRWEEGLITPDQARGRKQHMNDVFTPSTEQVRAAYVRAMRNAFIASAGEHEAEFDRWLAAVREGLA